MPSPDNAEVGSGVDYHISNNSVDLARGMNAEEKSMSMKCYSGSDGCVDSKDGILEECSIDGSKEKAEVGSYQVVKVKSEGLGGDMMAAYEDGNKSDLGFLGDGKCCRIEILDCSIEEGLEKVTLVGDVGLVQTDNAMKKVDTLVKEVSENNSDSDSESETSSASSSTSSSSSDDDDDDDDESDVGEEVVKETEKCNRRSVNTKPSVDMEEGQMVDSDADNMVCWSENDDDDDDDKSIENNDEFQFDDAEDEDIVKGPIKSKNELEVLPPVPPVEVTLQPCHQILSVGVISSVLGSQVIVEGSEKHNPLSEGSILWITESRLPLGRVDEIFGPVKTPYYIVRYNSESEVPSGIHSGTMVGFVAEFVGHVLNDKNLYQKGYDASGENDEEVLDELDFSDDEKEAEYKRMLKMSKRGNTNQGQGPGNMKKNRSRNKTWTKDQQPFMVHSPRCQSSQPGQLQQDVTPRNQLGQAPTGPGFSGGHVVPPSSLGYPLGSSPMGPFFPGAPATIPQQVQQAGLLLNGLLGNLMGLQQQNMGVSSGFQMNGMPWPQQNHPHNLQVPFQQPFDLSQLVGASNTPFRPPSFSSGPQNGHWVGTLGPNFPIQAPLSLGVQGQSSQLPMFSAQQGQSYRSQSLNAFPGNAEASSQFSQGSSSDRGGRGRGRRMFHHRGGRFSGGRGRH